MIKSMYECVLVTANGNTDDYSYSYKFLHIPTKDEGSPTFLSDGELWMTMVDKNVFVPGTRYIIETTEVK